MAYVIKRTDCIHADVCGICGDSLCPENCSHYISKKIWYETLAAQDRDAIPCPMSVIRTADTRSCDFTILRTRKPTEASLRAVFSRGMRASHKTP